MQVTISNKDPNIKCYLDGRRELLETITVEVFSFIFKIREGFIGDGSSIPRIFWRICGSPTTGANLLAGLIHDSLYKDGTFDRKTCDEIFYEILLELGKNKIIAYGMYLAVRAFGHKRYMS